MHNEAGRPSSSSQRKKRRWPRGQDFAQILLLSQEGREEDESFGRRNGKRGGRNQIRAHDYELTVLDPPTLDHQKCEQDIFVDRKIR